jgi:hypothetical protein
VDFQAILGNCAQCVCFVLRFAVRSDACWIFCSFYVCLSICVCVCVCVCVRVRVSGYKSLCVRV